MSEAAPVVLMMGVSGAGKSLIGALLAERLGLPFVEGDALHPPENVAKMARGEPLDDADRWPWLDAVAQRIDRWLAAGTGGVITCSALKRRYRDQLTAGRPGLRLVYLKGDRAMIARRLARRTGHFMPASLLDSQFATLEEPAREERVTILDAALSPDRLIAEIVARLAASPRA